VCSPFLLVLPSVIPLSPCFAQSAPPFSLFCPVCYPFLLVSSKCATSVFLFCPVCLTSSLFLCSCPIIYISLHHGPIIYTKPYLLNHLV
jgi:hypothetical protein